jgi:hypothetical protein
MRYIKQLLALAFVLLLASCGGGGGCSGTPFGTSGGTNSCGSTSATGSAAVSTVTAMLDKTTINNAGGDKALLTVTVLDGNNNVIGGVPVTVSVSSGIYSPITTTTATTGLTAGQVSGNISVGANKGNQNITATVTAGGVSTTIVVAVIGSRITITPLPATPALGASVTANIKATDSNGAGIPFAAITLSGSLGFTGIVTTDSTGSASATISAPGTAGTYTVNAAGVGVTGTASVQVVGGGGGSIPVVTATISAANLSINPNTIAPNPTGAVTNRAALKAVFQDVSNTPIPNVRVRFDILAPGLGNGEQISTGTTTVYSDSSGIATADYISGTRTSPTNGVSIRACYGPDDTSIAGGLCPSSITQTLTVASQPLSVSLSDNNEMSKANSNIDYIKKFVVRVNDSAGVAVPNALVSISVDITHYGKGYNYADPYYIYWLNNTSPPVIPLTTPPDITLDLTTGLNNSNIPQLGNYLAFPIVPGARIWCMNEDTNRNGFLDTSEDINGNGKLDPRKADISISYVNGNTTAADGTLVIQVQHGQNVATWLAYTVKVSTNVGGTEGTDQKAYVTNFIQGDETNGSFRTPPYGVGTCTNPL